MASFETSLPTCNGSIEFSFQTPADDFVSEIHGIESTFNAHYLELDESNMQFSGITRLGADRLRWRNEKIPVSKTQIILRIMHCALIEDIVCTFRGDHIEKTESICRMSVAMPSNKELSGSEALLMQCDVDTTGHAISNFTVNKKLLPSASSSRFDFNGNTSVIYTSIPFELPISNIEFDGLNLQLLKFNASSGNDIVRARTRLEFQPEKVLVSVLVNVKPVYREKMRDLNVQASIASLLHGNLNPDAVNVRIRPQGSYNSTTKVISWTVESLTPDVENLGLKLDALVDTSSAGGRLMTADFVPVIVRAVCLQPQIPVDVFRISVRNHAESAVDIPVSGKSRLEFKFLR